MSLERLRQRVLVRPRVPVRSLRGLVLSVWVRFIRLSHQAYNLVALVERLDNLIM